ncbi:MAG: hypothetical protein M1821_004775 [Bathelium mastoideum]|nr:MAG: hypothetical protein M1821_004775 [Bathelium mastoideum]
MEAAIRWSPHSTETDQQFLIIDVVGNRLELKKLTDPQSLGKTGYSTEARRERLPNFTAFDWSKTHGTLVGIGSASGEAILLDLKENDPEAPFVQSFPIRHQRKCNSIAFSEDNLVATGLDRVRNDFCMNVYDVNQTTRRHGVAQEPYRKLSSSEAITSIKFFQGNSQTLLAGVARQCIRFYDLRDSYNYGMAQFTTRYVHNLAIDPLDENYFLSAGPPGEPAVSVWDKRFISQTVPATPSSDGGSPGAVLELRPAIDYVTGSNSSMGSNASIWSLRFSGHRRGSFCLLASTGEIKSYEIASYAVDAPHVIPATNPLGGSAWNSNVYARRTHTVSLPWHEAHHGLLEESRQIAFDFMTGRGRVSEQSLIVLHGDRSVSCISGPSYPAHAKISGTEEFLVCKDACIITGRAGDPSQSISDELNSLRPPDEDGSESKPALNLDDALLRLTIQRRRCYEGYLFDCARNQRITADNLRLVDMWKTIGRLKDLADGEGMVGESLDLSYLGVASIWKRDFGRNVNRALSQPESRVAIDEAVHQIIKNQGWPRFERVHTQFPYHRQLCLSICGWAATKDVLEEKCESLLAGNDPYKAVVLATFHGRKDVASRILRQAAQNKQIANMGIATIIMLDFLTNDQREMCSWMAEESDDPYLKALLTRVLTGSWKSVANLQSLPLADRVGIAVMYFDDDSLGSFLDSTASTAIDQGNVEGLVLTGLGHTSLDLFQNYVSNTNDLQTAVLALSFSNPLYVRDTRYKLWKEIYHGQMQAWQAFLERANFIALHNRLAMLPRKHQELSEPDGPKSRPLKPRSVVKVPRGQITLRCEYCQKNIAISNLDDPPTPEEPESPPTEPVASSEPPPTKVSSAPPSIHNGPASGGGGRPAHRLQGRARKSKVCKNCGHPLPRCAVCQLWTGAPDPEDAGAREALATMDRMEGFLQHCLRCMHAFHPRHALTWFAKHTACPQAGCACNCKIGGLKGWEGES